MKSGMTLIGLVLLVLLILAGCPIPADPNTGGNGPNPTPTPTPTRYQEPIPTLALGCYRIYGDGDCRMARPNGMIAVGTTLGPVSFDGATAATTFALTGTNASRYRIANVSNMGQISVATAFAVTASTSDTLTVTATTSGSSQTEMVTINNNPSTATMETPPVGTVGMRGTDADGGARALTITEETVAGRCAAPAPCVKGSYTGGWGGWFLPLADLTRRRH